MSAFMEQRHLGRAGLRVSRSGLGTLPWGRDTHAHVAADLLRQSGAAGGSRVDPAHVYGDGEPE
jgi:aryl-alcohol dehydrogenase-like predicted oxidoreductase